LVVAYVVKTPLSAVPTITLGMKMQNMRQIFVALKFFLE
jgi:hypothetical protein